MKSSQGKNLVFLIFLIVLVPANPDVAFEIHV